MAKYEIVKQNNFIKKTKEKESEATMVKLTDLLLGIWDRDNSTKKNTKNYEAKGLITKYQMMNLKKK
jgi:hypothetical protein